MRRRLAVALGDRFQGLVERPGRRQAGRPPVYAIAMASAAGGPVTSSCGIVVDTTPLDAVECRSVATVLIASGERQPLLEAIADSLYVVDGDLWTSAGVTTGIDMALAMVAQDLGPRIAGDIAKRLVLYARRPGFQSQFSPVHRAQARADSPFAGLVDWINDHLDQPLDVPALAGQAGMSERTFHRKFQAATGQTPARYVETARLDASRLLLSGGASLKSVAVQVGLFPTPRFVEAFERRFGVSPRLFRDMHGAL